MLIELPNGEWVDPQRVVAVGIGPQSVTLLFEGSATMQIPVLLVGEHEAATGMTDEQKVRETAAAFALQVNSCG